MKRPWRERTERLAADLLEVPKDTLEHIPRIIIVGDQQVIVENHRAILELTDTRIRVAAASKEVEIGGRGLTVRTIVPEQLVVDGSVESIRIHT